MSLEPLFAWTPFLQAWREFIIHFLASLVRAVETKQDKLHPAHTVSGCLLGLISAQVFAH